MGGGGGEKESRYIPVGPRPSCHRFDQSRQSTQPHKSRAEPAETLTRNGRSE